MQAAQLVGLVLPTHSEKIKCSHVPADIINELPKLTLQNGSASNHFIPFPDREKSAI
jgi:hypothetical protein